LNPTDLPNLCDFDDSESQHRLELAAGHLKFLSDHIQDTAGVAVMDLKDTAIDMINQSADIATQVLNRSQQNYTDQLTELVTGLNGQHAEQTANARTLDNNILHLITEVRERVRGRLDLTNVSVAALQQGLIRIQQAMALQE